MSLITGNAGYEVVCDVSPQDIICASEKLYITWEVSVHSYWAYGWFFKTSRLSV